MFAYELIPIRFHDIIVPLIYSTEWRGIMSCRGKPLTSEFKNHIVSVKAYFDRSRIKPRVASALRTAEALGVGVATVKRVMADFNRDPSLLDNPCKMRGRPVHAVDSSHQGSIRTYIRSANKEGKYITLSTIKDYLNDISNTDSFHIATLARTLNRWGFEFGKGTRSQHLKEKDHVVVARRKYLRKKRANWAESSGIETIRPEVYLDESYVNKNHSNDFIWYFGEDGPWVQKPTGNGERLIILNAITQSGWVPDAKLIFKSTRKTGDYHGQMNFELFKKWFTEMLIPNIPENSIIIMDNASYHNTLADHSPPTAQSSKEKICKWLDENDVTYPDHCLKVELVELLTKQSPEPIYAIDEIAKSYGHEVIRTPPYHPELQPIEICWGVVKNHIARNCNFTMKNLIEQLGNGFDKVTSETCKKIIAKIRMHEDRFWSEDLQIDALETA